MFKREETIAGGTEGIFQYVIDKTVTQATWQQDLTLRGCIVAQFQQPLGTEKFTMNYIDEVFKTVPGMKCRRDNEEEGCLKSVCVY